MIHLIYIRTLNTYAFTTDPSSDEGYDGISGSNKWVGNPGTPFEGQFVVVSLWAYDVLTGNWRLLIYDSSRNWSKVSTINTDWSNLGKKKMLFKSEEWRDREAKALGYTHSLTDWTRHSARIRDNDVNESPIYILSLIHI